MTQGYKTKHRQPLLLTTHNCYCNKVPNVSCHVTIYIPQFALQLDVAT